MSKTDKTRPHRVKMLDKSTYYRENHDHRDGVCNLPPRPTRDNNTEIHWSMYWLSGDCQWVVSPEYWSSPQARCGCYMCSKYAYMPEPSRRRRREEKKYTRDAWRDEY